MIDFGAKLEKKKEKRDSSPQGWSPLGMESLCKFVVSLCMPKRILILLCLALVLTSRGQGPAVFSSSRQIYDFPWAGGMNSCQFGQVDLDLNGVADLVVFDRIGDRIMPFLAVSSGNSSRYRFAPEYAGLFPELTQWAVFEDYNLDGKTDIFTYSPGFAGMKVFKNVSEDQLEFKTEVYPYLKSFQGGGYVNILVTYADYPAITDLDGDGDLDILTFYGLGAFVEKHRNMSMEKYGTADSLDYVKVESCWGYFAESEETNEIALDTCLRCTGAGRQGGGEAGGDERHTGSTFRILDLNADALPDLLLGDVDYPNVVALYNGGTIDTARMISYDWQYPAGDQTVDLFSMPAAFYMDVDFDGVKDLLVSPFDPNPFLPENFQSTLFYHNDGTNDQPQFYLYTSSFLQDEMLDFGAGAYPVFVDIDQDGLTDLFVGNYGYYDTSYYDENLILHTLQTSQLAWLKNTGTAQLPAFTLADRDFAGTSELRLIGLTPAFGDLDGDGNADLLLGSENGKIILFINNSNPGEAGKFDLTETYYQSVDVGSFSAPQLFDLDRDGLDDLIIGEKGGNLNYYRNTGTPQNPAFTYVTDSLGKINVTDYNVSLDGYSTPFFYCDQEQNTHLLVGSEQGEIFYYTGIDGNLNGAFILSDSLNKLIGIQSIETDFGYRSSAALTDLDQDGYPEFIAGNFSGGLNYLGKNAQSPVNGINDDSSETSGFLVYPNPSAGTIHFSSTAEIAEVILFDYTGKEIFHCSSYQNGVQSLDLNEFPSGIYFLKILEFNSEKKSYQEFFVKIIHL